MTGQPLPPYTHVPGRTPHPVSDPAGHSFGRAVLRPESFNSTDWRSSREYRRGIELFNHGFYWEAHEEWEALWHAAGRAGPTADFLKGLIQLAVCGVKHYQQMPEGLRTHARRAAELFRPFDERCVMGLAIAGLIEFAERLEHEGWPAQSSQLQLPEE